jgi:hypothetical protein
MREMRKMKTLKYLLLTISLLYSAAPAVEIYSVAKSGRMVQLDGFLLEWNKDGAKALSGSPWVWDAINTKEGLTGYFKAIKPLSCHDWTFTLLPRRLSPYASMKMSTSPAAPQTFYRLTLPYGGPDSSVVMEWVIPWDSIALDSSGSYQIGLMAVDSCGDTLTPVIFNGHAYASAAAAPWSKVYSKGIFLAVLLVLLYLLQKTTKRKFTVKRKR